jgi:RNA-directed DNA polymerase
MKTKLEGIAKKAQQERKLKFTSLAHHITKEMIWDSLCHIDPDTSPGTDDVTATSAKRTFNTWIDSMIQSIHREGYKPPTVKRCWIPKPGKQEKRPIGIPCVADRALQRSVSTVLAAIYEQDFLPCSFGGRPNIGQHHALATLNEIIRTRKVNYVLEADIKNYFGSLDHNWLIKFVEHRVGDPRIISLIRRWLKAGILENDSITIPDQGTPQGGSTSVLLSNIYLHYVLDLWFEKKVKPILKGEVYLIRYIDDFIVCFQYLDDAKMFQEILIERLAKFSLSLEPSKTRLIEFGRFAQQDVKRKGKKLETLYFLGFTHFCTNSREGKFLMGRKTEKSRFKRAMQKIKATMQEIMHNPIEEQIEKINQFMRGHYNYYGLGGNYNCLVKIYRNAERIWKTMLSNRSQKSYVTWNMFKKIKERFPILRPRLKISYMSMKALAIL